MPKSKEGTTIMKVAEIDSSEKTREDAGDLVSLAKSIKEHGFLNLIIVDGTSKKLIAGWRRLEAYKILKLEEVEVRLFEKLTPLERRIVEIEEEITHKKIRSWQEEVSLKKELHDLKMKEHSGVHVGVREKRAWSQEHTANLLGVGRTSLSEDIRLAEAMQHFPELATVTSKTDARRKMYRLRELALLQELARRGRLDPLASKVNFFHGDCIEGMKNIPSESVDLVITDPPWGINLRELAGASAIDYKTFADDDTIKDLYEKSIPEIFRVLKEGCHLYLFFAMERYHDVHESLVKAGFDVRPVPCIWMKDRPSYTAWEYKPMPRYEGFFFACKNTKQQPRRLREATDDIFVYARGKERIHITEKPVELLKRLIFLSSEVGEIVLDPFAGSGSTLIASMMSDRRAVGFEKDKETYEWALGRLKAIALDDIASKEVTEEVTEEVTQEVAEEVAQIMGVAPSAAKVKELTDDEIAEQSLLEEEAGGEAAEA